MGMLPEVLFFDDVHENLTQYAEKLNETMHIHVASSLKAALRIIETQDIDVAVVNYQMNTLKRHQFIEDHLTNHPSIFRIILVDVVDAKHCCYLINEQMVRRIYCKPLDFEKLAEGIMECYLERKIQLNYKDLTKRIKGLLNEMQHWPLNPLTSSGIQLNFTPKEQEVFSFLVLGKSSKQIASELNISKRTVENHRSNMMRKAQVNSTTALIHKFTSSKGEELQED